MTYQFGLTGKDRKTLVTAISEILGTDRKYCGPPRYEFTIGDYTVDRDGTLTGPDNISLLAWLADKGFKPETGGESFEAPTEAEISPEAVAKPEEEAAGAEDQTEPEIAEAEPHMVPETAQAEAHTEPDASETETQTDTETFAAEEQIEPEVADTNPQTETDAAYAEPQPEPQAQIEPQAQPEPETMTLTIEYPLEHMTDAAIINLRKLIASKEPLLKMALGADDLPIIRTDSTLQFPWFRGEIDSDSVKAYAQLIACLCEAAKRKKRVTAGVVEPDNPRFQLRVFLVSLGMVGEKYAKIRQLMIKSLPGESGWRFGKPEKAVIFPAEQGSTDNADSAPADNTGLADDNETV